MPGRGRPDWHTPLNENFEKIDSDIQELFDGAADAGTGFVDQVRDEEEVLPEGKSLVVATMFKTDDSFKVEGDLRVV